jgi:hypothetical protein
MAPDTAPDPVADPAPDPVADPARPPTRTPAQARLVDEVLGWGAPRPVVPAGLLDRLLARTTEAVAAWLEARARHGVTRPLIVTKSRLARLACDGLQRDPVPYAHTRANARGTLAHAAIEQDVDGARDRPAADVAAAAWARLASDRAGDPSSLAAWLNATSHADREVLVGEVAGLLEAFREVWPPLDAAGIRVVAEGRVVVDLGGRAVRLQGVPDLVVTSPRRDGRARTLVVDLKTGMPRGQQERDELRFYALLLALRDGVPPFRWATLHVTEGRVEAEDLSAPVLATAAARIADAVHQAARLLDGSEAEVLRAGEWCRSCRREPSCPVAAAR